MIATPFYERETFPKNRLDELPKPIVGILYERNAPDYLINDKFEPRQQVEFSPHDLRHLRVTRAVTKIRKNAKGDAAEEAALLEGFQELMGWRSRETMATYTKTMNKRQAIKAVLDDEEAVVVQQEQDAVTAQREAPPVQTQPPCTEKDRSRGGSALLDDHDDLSWYEDDV